MNFLDFIYGLVLGILLIGNLFSIFLYVKNYERKINFAFILLTIVAIAEVNTQLIFMYQTNLEHFIFFQKVSNSIQFLGAIPLILLFSAYTNYYNSKAIWVISVYSVILSGLNLVFPFGLLFNEIIGIKQVQIVGNSVISVAIGEPSAWNYNSLILLLFILIYTFWAFIKIKKTGNRSKAFLILFVFVFLIASIFVNVILILNGVNGYSIIETSSYLLFAILVTHQNIDTIIRSVSIKKQLVESKESLQAIFEVNPSAILIVDMHSNKILEVNKSFSEFLGLHTTQIIGNRNGFWYKDESLRNEYESRCRLGKSFEIEIQDLSLRNKTFLVSTEKIKYDSQNSIIISLTDITSQKEIQNSISENEIKFRSLFDNSTDAIFLIKNKRYFDCNQKALELFKVRKEEIIGKDPVDFSPQYQLNNMLSSDMRDENLNHLKVSKSKTFFWKHKVANGELIDTEVSLTKIILNDEEIIQAIVKDVTQKLKSEKELKDINKNLGKLNDISYRLSTIRTNEELENYIPRQLKEISGAIAVSFGIYDKESKSIVMKQLEVDSKIFNLLKRITNVDFSTMVNPVDDKMYSEITNQLVGIKTNLSEVTFGVVNQLASKIIQSTLRIDRFLGIAYLYRGELFGTSVLAIRIGDPTPNEELLKSIASITGVTLRRIEIERNLSQSESLYRTLLEGMNEVVMQVDNDDRILYVNNRFVEIFGYSKEEVIGKIGYELLLDPENYGRIKSMNLERTTGIYSHYEISFKTQKGEYLPFLVSGSPMYDKNGNVYGSIGVMTDISELKQNEQLLKYYNKRLKLINEITTSVIGEETLNNAVSKMMKSIISAFEVDTCIIRTLTGNNLDLLAAEGIDYDLLAQSLPSNVGISKRIIETRSPYIIEDVTSDDITKSMIKKDRKHFQFISYAGVPLLIRDNVIGILGVYTTSKLKNFSNEDIQQLQTGANHIAVTIENQRLFDEELLKTEEIKATSNALRESEELLTSTLSSMDDLVLVLDDNNYCISYYYPNPEKFFNNSEKIIGYPINEILNSEIVMQMQNSIELVRKNLTVESFDFSLSMEKENSFWSAKISPRKDIQGKFAGVTLVAREITDIILGQIEISDAYKYIQYVVDSIATVIISTDSHFNVKHYNKEAEKFKVNKHVVKQNLFVLFPKLNFISDELSEVRDSGTYLSRQKTVGQPGGEVEYYSVAVAPLANITDPGFVIMIDNITERVKMEDMMIQSEKMLTIAGLAAGMAHEINNPLGTIVQGCQNILRRVSNEIPKNIEVANQMGLTIENLVEYFKERQIYDIIDSMRVASAKASDIIKNMLQFSRRTESKQVLMSIAEVIDEAIELAYNDYDMKKRIDFKSINIIKEYEDNLPKVKLNVTEIEQVIFNIIKNAAQAIKSENDKKKHYHIILRVRRGRYNLVIEIEDNGPGIPEEIKNRIFEPFFTTKEVGEGTGLGLSVSYMIITKNHKGNITVESTLSKGTKFSIRIPLSE
ncbi:MAG TPA: PAS domain S-box protein [Ignavibacteriaceae bacterium]|nr:PAS domain S-box protein [Ignavibacteriaceae bacterium]